MFNIFEKKYTVLSLNPSPFEIVRVHFCYLLAKLKETVSFVSPMHIKYLSVSSVA